MHKIKLENKERRVTVLDPNQEMYIKSDCVSKLTAVPLLSTTMTPCKAQAQSSFDCNDSDLFFLSTKWMHRVRSSAANTEKLLKSSYTKTTWYNNDSYKRRHELEAYYGTMNEASKAYIEISQVGIVGNYCKLLRFIQAVKIKRYGFRHKLM